MHANFFLNLGQASAADVYELIRRAREKVAEIFGVYLELEIELIGDWPEVGA
jgi:UDP-N-acetylmuramate dehydrogenase